MGRILLRAAARPVARYVWRPFTQLELVGWRVYPALFYLSLGWTLTAIAFLEVRDLIRYTSSSVALELHRPMLSSGGSLSHGAVAGGVAGRDGGGGGVGPTDGEIVNLRLSEGGGHDIPEWVLEPASGQFGTRVVGVDPMQEVKDCLIHDRLQLHECTAKFAKSDPKTGADGLKTMLANAKVVADGKPPNSAASLDPAPGTEERAAAPVVTQGPRSGATTGGTSAAAGDQGKGVARGAEAPGSPGRSSGGCSGCVGCGERVDADAMRGLLTVMAEAQQATRPPCWALTARALRMPFQTGAVSAKTAGADGGAAGGRAAGGGGTSGGQGLGSEQTIKAAPTSSVVDGGPEEPYEMMRQGFSARGQDVHVLHLLQRAGALDPVHAVEGVAMRLRGHLIEIGLTGDGMHTCMHAHTHARMCTCMLSLVHACLHIHAFTCTDSHAYSPVHEHTLARLHG